MDKYFNIYILRLYLLQVCLFRSGLVGAVMKLPCCDGATCTLLGSKFVCVDDK